MWQSPCHYSLHLAQGKEGPYLGKAWLKGGVRWWQGKVGGQGTQQRGGEPHHQALVHSQAVCRLQTPLSSDGVANTTGTVLTTSWPALWQPVQRWQMTHKSTRQGVDQHLEAESGGVDSGDWGEWQPA